MKKPEYDESWSDVVKLSYGYDEIEIHQNRRDLGYSYSYQNRRQLIFNLISKYMSKGFVIDIAGAHGNFSLPLAEKGYNVIWNDLREDLENYVKLKYEKGNIDYKLGNVFDLSFDKKFDAAIISEIIEHVAHPDQFLKKVASLVKKGGWIFMTTPNGEYLRNNLPKFSDCVDFEKYESIQFGPGSEDHIFLFYANEIINMAKSTNLEIKEMQIITNFLTIGHMKMRYLLRLFPKNIIFLMEKLTQKLPFFIQRKINNTLVVVFQVL